MSFINFPNVPNVPGVPSLLRNFTIPTQGQLLNKLIGGAAEAIFGKTVWGIFEDVPAVKGTPSQPERGSRPFVAAVPAVAATIKEILFPDSFLDIEYKQDIRVSNFPQEEGAFASYNKVGTPYECRIKLAIGADKDTRTKFMDKLDQMILSLDLYTIVTPEATYINASLRTYDYRREAKNGVSMIIFDLSFIEVRIIEDLTAIDSDSDSAADPVSAGQVQTPVIPEVASGVGSKLSQITKSVIGTVQNVVGTVKSVVSTVQGVVSTVQGAIAGAVGAVQGAITMAKNAVYLGVSNAATVAVVKIKNFIL